MSSQREGYMGVKQKSHVEIVAVCSNHGRYQLKKKLNKHQSESGAAVTGYYDAVVCPKCRLWSKIISQEIVVDATPEKAAQVSLL